MKNKSNITLDDKLLKELRRCGMSTFVNYYQELINLNNLNKGLAESLMVKEGYTYNSALTKISSARRIVKSSKGKTVLSYISNRNGKYITSQLKNKAKKLLE